MEHALAESKADLYDVYYTEDGTRLIVLEGLDPEQRVEHYPMQEFFIQHVDAFIVFYWLLIASVAVYLLSMYILLPLWYRKRA